MTNNIEPIRILYVDDETELLNVGKLFLEKDGNFSVDVLPSVSEALNYLNSTNYEAIISDYEMPEMNGISFLKTLRASGNTTPFIIFTGKGREEVVIEALNCGADFYIQKGGNPKAQFAELSNKVRYAVSRKRTENLLKESEERYRNVVEDQTEFICRFLPDGTHVFVNEAYCRYFGLDRNEMIGSKFRLRMPAEDGQKVSRQISSLTSNNPYAIIEHRIFMPDGNTRWQRWVDRAIFNVDGDLKEYQSVGRDITELKERELALNEKNYQLQTTYEQLAFNEEQLRKQIEENKIVIETLTDIKASYYEFFKTARDSVFITTPDGQWIDFNDAALELFGYESRGELFNVSVLSVYAHPEERSAFLKRVELEGYVKEYPLQLKKCDGKVFDSIINIASIHEQDGSIKSFIGSFRNITEQKQMEATLRESEKKYRDIINNMQDVVYRTDLEGKLIMFSPHGVKLAGYDSEEEMIGFDVALDTYQNPEERERFLAALKEKGFVENDLPSIVEVFADLLIGKVFYNLIDNAMRHGVKITTIRFSMQESEDSHLILCEDDGEGIPAEEKSEIFERGFGKNSGLGLTLVREILDITGITIRETGEPGRGARFEITVPNGKWRYGS